MAEDIRALAEATLADDVSQRTARIRAQQTAPELARFALAVLDALDTNDRLELSPSGIRAAIARNLEARRG